MKSYRVIFAILSLLLSLEMGSLKGQDIYFNKVLLPRNQSFKTVNDITQDLHGCMWFSSSDGIYFYDGKKVTPFRHDPFNPNSISTDLINIIYTDPESGVLWIGTPGGLETLDPVTGVVKHFRDDPGHPLSTVSLWVNVIFRDHTRRIWIGTCCGLYGYDEENDSLILYKTDPGDPTSLSCDEIVSIYEDRQKTLWIGTGSVWNETEGAGGLNRFNRESETFTRFMSDPENPDCLINNCINAIFEDSRGTFWIGTAGDGLHTMDRSSGIFKRHRYDPARPGKLSRPPLSKLYPDYDFITFITEDITGAIWIGTRESGLTWYDPVSERIRHFEAEGTEEGKFTDRTTSSAYTSREGVLWISAVFGDLYRVDPFRKTIPHYPVPGHIVNCFYKDQGGTLWIGTQSGLKQQAPDGRILERSEMDFYPAELERSYVSSIDEDRQGNLMITSDKGFFKWNKDKKLIAAYRHEPGNQNSLAHSGVLMVYEEDENNSWIGTMIGLHHLDKKTGSVSRFYVNREDTTSVFASNMITAILKDKTGKFWVGTWSGGGLYQFDRGNARFIRYQKNITFVRWLHEDRSGTVWVGTSNGLYYYDRAMDSFLEFKDLKDFYKISSLLGILEDDKGNLWLSTENEILKIPGDRQRAVIFGKRNGIQQNSLYYNSCYKGDDGILYFGGRDGFYSFNPSELIDNPRPPEIYISNLRISDRLVDQEINATKSGSLVSAPESISLTYNQNTFSFDFNVIDFTNPDDNILLYKLENYDDAWRDGGFERRAQYFNVPPGNYKFQVKGINSRGNWALKEVGLTILAPWYKTWWAYLIYGLVFFSGVFGIDRFQRHRLLLAERERTRKREREQARQIEKAYRELKSTQAQLIHAEKLASLGELTAGIAHEIQNPLNFVNNFAEISLDLVREVNMSLENGQLNTAKDLSADIGQNLEKIHYHGKKASSIVKGMLEHSRSGTGQKVSTDINILADEYLRLAFHGFKAKDKSFNAAFRAELDHDLPGVQVVPQEISRVLLNLISNAFYAVNKRSRHEQNGYLPTVVVSTRQVAGMVEIRVKDNGDGIPGDIRDKIFQPFFTTKPAGEGTGLGLSLSYDIITKGHQGSMKVESTEGEGTEFIILIPINHGQNTRS